MSVVIAFDILSSIIPETSEGSVYMLFLESEASSNRFADANTRRDHEDRPLAFSLIAHACLRISLDGLDERLHVVHFTLRSTGLKDH